MRRNIEELNVIKAFDVYNSYKVTNEDMITLSKSENYIRHITDNSTINYSYRNNKFEKSN